MRRRAGATGIGPDELDDAGLVHLAQAGDDDAFAELFRRHFTTVRRTCAHRMGSLTEADDVAQAAFVRAYERIHQCNGEARFAAWVRVIALRLCADACRERARVVPVEAPVPGPGAVTADDCEAAVLRSERVAELRRALDALPSRQRDVVIARDVVGRRPGEIAATLAVSIGAVDSLLMRARRRLALVVRATGTELGSASTTVCASSVSLGSAAATADTLAGIVRAVATRLYWVAASVAGHPLPRMGPGVAGATAAVSLLLAPLLPDAAPDPAVVPPAAVELPAPVAPIPAPATAPTPPALPAPTSVPAPVATPPPPTAVPAPELGSATPPTPPAVPPVAPPPSSLPAVPSAPVPIVVGEAQELPTAAVGRVVAGAGGAIGEGSGVEIGVEIVLPSP
jgi:RNA polymerase sigma-70 factor (ECF subfamily)